MDIGHADGKYLWDSKKRDFNSQTINSITLSGKEIASEALPEKLGLSLTNVCCVVYLNASFLRSTHCGRKFEKRWDNCSARMLACSKN